MQGGLAVAKTKTMEGASYVKEKTTTVVAPLVKDQAIKFRRWAKDGPLALKIICFGSCCFCLVVAFGEFMKAAFGKNFEFVDAAVAVYAFFFAFMGCLAEGASLTALEKFTITRKMKRGFENWCKFMQRVWGRGIFYLFVSFMQFAQGSAWGIMAGIAMFVSAILCFIVSKLLSRRLNKLSDEMLAAYSSKMADSTFAKKYEELEQEKRAHLLGIFSEMDTDSSGDLSPAELTIVVKNLGADFTDEELLAIFNQLDTDGNGSVSFEEFASWWFGTRAVSASWV